MKTVFDEKVTQNENRDVAFTCKGNVDGFVLDMTAPSITQKLKRLKNHRTKCVAISWYLIGNS